MERQPRILLYDVETTPLTGTAYGTYNTDIIEVLQHPYVLCFSYRWLNERKTHNVALRDFEARYRADPKDDEDVVLALWYLFDEADILIAHNAKGFDNRVATGRFIVYKKTPPSPYKTVDTLLVARKIGKFSNNKLDVLGQQLQIGRKSKVTHGQLLNGVLSGQKVAWNKMVAYNNQDVNVLLRLYLRFLPYIDNHPNLATISHMPDACPKCGHRHLQRQGYYYGNTYTYQKYVCVDCGGWGRVRLSEKGIEKPLYVNAI
jgi:hypothetical protein